MRNSNLNRYIQIHSFHGYAAVLLNRDDTGQAKRMTYGGTARTRVSSQCIKRHWRTTSDENAIQKIDGTTASVRSRDTVEKLIVPAMESIVGYDADIGEKIRTEVLKAVYGDKATDRQTRQPLLLGREEIDYLAAEAAELMKASLGGTDTAETAIAAWAKGAKPNLRTMRENCAMPGGIEAAMFGRMMTADPAANLDAAVHVAHSFTVHAEEAEPDFFTVVDDLMDSSSEAAADHIGETEITCGLFYGYTVIAIDTLLENIGDPATAAEAASRLVKLIARTSPGAKVGPTAPYSYASYMLIEAGTHQPRSLAEAFRTPCKASANAAVQKLHAQLERLDAAFGCHEERRVLAIDSGAVEGLPPHTDTVKTLNELADWTADRITQETES